MGRTLTQEEFPFCGPTYLAISPVLDAERSINLYLYPERAPNGANPKSLIALIGTPGLSAPVITLPGGPARALGWQSASNSGCRSSCALLYH
jgi:hypothetical protein